LLVSTLAISPVWAVDESRLWLPSNFEKRYLDLLSSAKAAESLERCETVIRGTIDLEQSTRDKPIFRIQCRQENGRTYNEMVDGTTHKTLTTVIEEPKVLSPEEMEAARLEQEKKRLEAEGAQKAVFLEQCLTSFRNKTKLFQSLDLVNEAPEPEEFTMESAKFYLDFGALNLEGQKLSYRAICLVSADQPLTLHIRTRRY